MRRFTPLALVATVVTAFIIAKGCLPNRNLGTKAATSLVPQLPEEPTAPRSDPPGKTAPPR